MNNNQATSSSIKMATSRSDTVPYTVSKLFYESVRTRFLQQSARYLRTGIAGGNAVSRVADKKQTQHKVKGPYQPCY